MSTQKPPASEQALVAQIQLELSRGDTRLLRANAGVGWTGTVVNRTAESITLSPFRPFRAMPAGVLDLIGWHGGRFLAIEAKYGYRKATVEQIAFIELVRRCGGLAGVAYTLEEAKEIACGVIVP